MYTGGLWCPHCGAEYRPGFEECADCRVPLTDERPPPRVEPEVDHGQVEYDLEDWTAQQRAALELVMVGRDLPHGWDGAHLLVPRVREAEVDEIVDELDGEAPGENSIEDEVGNGSPEDEAGRGPGDIAGPGRRFVGSLVDTVVLTPVTVPLSRVVLHIGRNSPAGPRLAVLGAPAMYAIVGVAVWGRTLGKLVAGTRVLNESTGRPPGWWRATLRWVAQALVELAALFFARRTAVALPLIEVVYLPVLYGGILWDQNRQGLHDKLAGTIVVVA